MPKMTVYIPAHNYGKYIEKAIGSVLCQTIDDWELIVINDGSTDNTKDKIEKYKDNDKIRIIEQENKGLIVTNNIAIRLSSGKYIMRLDADDYLDENILLVLSNILDKYRDVGLVYPDYYIADESGQTIEIVRRKKIGEEVELLDLPAHGACTMIRKECLINMKGYEEEFRCQDGYDLWIRFLKTYKPYNVNIPLFYYRQHSGSITTNKKNILETRRKIKRKYVDEEKNGERPRVLGLIPVTGKSIYSQADPFMDLAGKSLIWYTISEALKSKHLDEIVVNSDEKRVCEYVKRWSRIKYQERDYEYMNNGNKIEEIELSVLEYLERTYNYKPDAVCLLYITTPCRKSYHIDKAIDTLTIFDVDSVVSIQEELSYFYFHRKLGLTPIVERNSNIRAERNAIFRENGAIYLSRVEVVKKRRMLGERIGHITMLPEESIKINSEYDYWLAQKIKEKDKIRN